MKKIISVFISSLLLFTVLSAQEYKGWKKASTNHFNFIYEPSAKDFAQEYALYADEAWNAISRIYGFPQDKTNVYVTDRTNTVNAFTYSAPLEIVMFTTPIITPEFGFRTNWQRLFFTHELIHVANMQFEDKSIVANKLIGPYANVFSLSDVPGWGLEGLTTVLETELTEGGRGRSPFFEMLYKAPTLDNGFISYEEIGSEAEPPAGQAYVMGYLIMRSIADRWGLQALADIERNRKSGTSWEDSVHLVTGCTAADIYRDARIALGKKFNGERKIPEGQIISPRNTGFYYYKPSIVFDDGSFITLRSSPYSGAAVVKFRPEARYGSNWYVDTNPDKDLNTVYKETILFTGSFGDETSVTADGEGNIYASMANSRKDRSPGYEVEYALYSFNETDGVKQITNGISLFQPSVSRDGNTLVAVQQKGLKMRIVKVNPSTGEIEPLLESENLNFIQPALNTDGTKLAFLEVSDERAKVCILDLKNFTDVASAKYDVVANGSGQIVDPSFPSWNSDGSLTYTCNTRGRLEVYEVTSGRNGYVSNAVVSDPIAAISAYKTSKGIIYTSYASSGYVIKIKPVEEWGKVPSFNGPSMPGTIAKFGDYVNDYPNFKPFDIPSEVELTKEQYEESKSKIHNNDDEPKPVEGKYVLHRSEENKAAAADLPAGKTELSEESKYVPGLQPLLYIPTIDFQSMPNGKTKFGFGYAVLAQTPRLQMSAGELMLNVDYFPGINNFEAFFGGIIPVGPSTFAFWTSRGLSVDKDNTPEYLDEKHELVLGYTKPLYNRATHDYFTDIEVIASVEGKIIRSKKGTISFLDKVDPNYKLSGQLGLDCSRTIWDTKDYVTKFNATALGIGIYSFDYNKVYVGGEGEFSCSKQTATSIYQLDLKTRYTNFPQAEKDFMSRATLDGIRDDCYYPGKIVVKGSYVLPGFLLGLDGRLFAETLFNFGRNTVDVTGNENDPLFSWSKSIYAGGELGFSSGRMEFYGGFNSNFNLNTYKFEKPVWYVNCKLDWFRK